MDSFLINLASSHSPLFVVGAAIICAITAWLILSLLEQASVSSGRQRLNWLAGVALGGGLGVWTTHFIAMLGFRPDFPLGYSASITVASAMIGTGLIGLPLAATALTENRLVRIGCGAVAGGGVAAMHFTGMLALQGCIVSHSPTVVIFATLLGITLFALAFAIPAHPRSKGVVAALIVAGVCAVHFLAMTGVSIEPIGGGVLAGVDHVTLGTVVAVIALCLFATASSSAVSSAKLEEQTRQGVLLSAALNNMSNGLLLISPAGKVILRNDRLLKLFGIDESHVTIGMSLREYLNRLGVHLGWSAMRINRVIENHIAWFARSDTTYLEHSLDDGRVISVACRPMSGGGAVLTYDDVTVERKAQKDLERLAFVDSLTDLPNRRAVKQELGTALNVGEEIALLFIDLDHFKTINDTLGHAVGDQLLIDVGYRLRGLCSQGEYVARLGGDELAMISRGTADEAVNQLAGAIVAAIAEPFSIRDHSIVIGCTVGVATTRDTRDADTLIQYADLALFRAKSKGRGRSQLYEAGMQEAAKERRRIEGDLRLALSCNQFSLVFQPLCRIADGAIIGFEALIRWSHPEHGPVPPDRFIPLAEETGMILEIGEWALREACFQAAAWPVDVHVAVNVSPVQLRSKAFVLSVAKALADCDLSPSRLEIELTETALVEDGLQIAVSLQALRQLGIRVSMDDFGTGYSSFAHLVDFDLDRIKIDRSFVQAAPGKDSARAVVRAVVQMARDLDVFTIGEGVETAEQLALLERLGCDAAQGYLLGRPMPATAARDLLRSQAVERQAIRAH